MKIYSEDTPLERYMSDQLSVWELARDNFRALRNVRSRKLIVGGLEVVLQFNPARIVSSSARIDKETLAARKCFLCRNLRTGNESYIPFHGRKGKDYDILVNPYPIFQKHFTVPSAEHTPQSISHRYVDMLAMAKKYRGYTIFYNGPKCGASAPDHMHFQAGTRGIMPIEDAVLEMLPGLEAVASHRKAELYNPRIFTEGIFVIRSQSSKDAAKLFYRLLDCCPLHEGDSEPMINLLSFYEGDTYYSIVFVRGAHRSHHYYAEGDDNIFMSLGSVDMGGVFIAALEKDFDKVTAGDLESILAEVSVTRDVTERIIERMQRTQMNVSVGIMSAPEISFRLLYDGAGLKKAVLSGDKILYDGVLYDELYFEAPYRSTMFEQPSFELEGVTIGKDFHWERKETQKFAGALKLFVSGDGITAVNILGVEDYLLSVISSEMNASAPEEFLKAHAVISRSWLVARMKGMNSGNDGGCTVSEDEVVRWYDSSDHDGFDVCADDHCQRYQGMGRVSGGVVRKVIDETWGEVLLYGDTICDARFSKCCGGVMERFSACWQDKDYPYLVSKEDPYCNTDDAEVLSTVLNGYDRETKDFYRWRVSYDAAELSDIVRSRSGIDFGMITGIEPLDRGGSGRIFRLKITGTRKSLVIGKELEIRRVLSRSHLYSSAFDVTVERDSSGAPVRFVFDGRGWGHGVGLCQIGAAVMGSRGFTYRQILEHYYPGTEIKDIYKQVL